MKQRGKTRQRGRARVTASRVHVHGVCEDVCHELHVVVVVVTFTSILTPVLDVVHMALVDVVAVEHSFRSQFCCLGDIFFTLPVGDSELR